MSVRPVDVLTMLPRLNEASRLQANAETQPFVAQHAATTLAVDKAIKERQQVHERKAAGEATIRQDAKQKNSEQGGQQRPRKDRGLAEQKPAPSPQPGNRLDVKL